MVPDCGGAGSSCSLVFFFFNDTATTEIYTLSLHDALPIRPAPEVEPSGQRQVGRRRGHGQLHGVAILGVEGRSEEHTSELQSRPHLVCRLLLEKKNPRTTGNKELIRLVSCDGRYGKLTAAR